MFIYLRELVGIFENESLHFGPGDVKSPTDGASLLEVYAYYTC
jgi:hypothetical protein